MKFKNKNKNLSKIKQLAIKRIWTKFEFFFQRRMKLKMNFNLINLFKNLFQIFKDVIKKNSIKKISKNKIQQRTTNKGLKIIRVIFKTSKKFYKEK